MLVAKCDTDDFVADEQQLVRQWLTMNFADKLDGADAHAPAVDDAFHAPALQVAHFAGMNCRILYRGFDQRTANRVFGHRFKRGGELQATLPAFLSELKHPD